MTNSRRKKQKFFDQNPHCCFCGGGEKAVERDHIPPKCLFRDKNLPGNASLIEFPACKRCNQSWRYKDEAVAAVSILCGCKNCDSPDNENDLKRAMRYLRSSKFAQQILPTENLSPTLALQNGLLVTKIRAEFKWKEFFNLIAESSAKYATAYYYRYSGKPLPPGSLIAAMAIPSEIADSVWDKIAAQIIHKQHDLNSKKETYSDQIQVWFSNNENFSLFSAVIQIRANFRSLVFIASEELGAPHDMFDGSDLRQSFNIYQVQDGAPIVLKHSAVRYNFGNAVSARHSTLKF